MGTEIALYAVYRAIRTRLTAGAETWGTRAYPDQAPAGAARPYTVFSFAGGGELNAIRAEDSALLIDILCVAESMAQAMSGAARIAALFNDQGSQDRPITPLSGGTEWTISTVTQEQAIHLIENVEGAQQIYIDGARYRCRLERI
jgi:hypothetical protein